MRTGPWPVRPIATATPIAVPGTARRPCSGSTKRSPTELEQSAGRARARGGLAAAAAFLQRAADLTPDPAQRARRALDAALAKHEAGASESALQLLTVARSGPLDALQRARADLLDAQVMFHLSRDRASPGMMVAAARSLAPLDGALARETYLHALDAAIINGGGDAARIAEAASTAPPPVPPARPVDLLLDGLAATLTQGFTAGAPALRRALEAFRDSHHPDRTREPEVDRWLWLAGRNAVAILDDELVHVLASRNVQLAREAGALATLPAALSFLSITSVLMGELATAGELADEATAITRDIGGVQLRHAHIILSAWRGDEAETTALDAHTAQDPAHPAEGTDASMARYATSVLHNGLGNYAAAQEAASPACDSPELSLSSAPARARRGGRPRRRPSAGGCRGRRARARERPRPEPRGRRGLAARSRALTSTDRSAEEHYREAIEQLRNCRMAVTSPAPTSSTASGSAARAAARTPANSCAPPTRCCRPWARRRSPPAPPASCAPPVSTHASGPPSPPTLSPPRSCTSRDWSPPERPPARSVRSCS